MRELIIDGTRIGDDRPAYVIAEIGHNHGGNLARAKSMVLTAKAMGASAVKFQTRYPDHTYARGTEPGAFDFVSDNPQWMDPVYGRHRWALEFSESEWQELFDYCRNTGITAFSTPFDHRSGIDSLAFTLDIGIRGVEITVNDLKSAPRISPDSRQGVRKNSRWEVEFGGESARIGF